MKSKTNSFGGKNITLISLHLSNSRKTEKTWIHNIENEKGITDTLNNEGIPQTTIK